MKARKERLWPSLALVAIAVAVGLLWGGLGSLPLTDRDEGEYGAAVAQMRRSGDYVIPRLNGQLYLEKPILVFWAVLAGQAVTSSGEAGARLPSALSAFGLMLVMAALAQRVSGSRSLSVLTAMSVAFMPLMVLLGRACLTDMLLSFFTTASLAAFFLACESAPGRDKPWWLLAWAGLALGFLTKGPVALAVVLPSAGLYALLEGRLWELLKRCRPLWGLLIFLGVNLPWYGLAFYQLGEVFWRGFFVSQNARRFSEVLLGHGGGFFYYLPVLLLGCFPISAGALPALSAAVFANSRAARRADPMARLRLLAGLSVLVVLIVFTLAATKQINYILPALPFWGMLAAYFFWRSLSGEAPGRLASHVWQGGLWLMGGLLALALLAIPWGLPLAWERILGSIRPDSSEYALPAQAPSLWLWPLLAAAAVLLILFSRRLSARLGRQRLTPLAHVLLGALFSAALVLGLLGQAGQMVQAPAKEMAMQARVLAGPDSSLLSYGLWKPSLLYYLDRDVPRLRTDEEQRLGEDLGKGQPVLVMSRLSLAPRLEQVPGFVSLRAYEGYLLGGNQQASDLLASSAKGAATP